MLNRFSDISQAYHFGNIFMWFGNNIVFLRWLKVKHNQYETFN